MAHVAFLGDELMAAGMRLCGARVSAPPRERAAEEFRRLAADAPELLILTAEYAAALPPQELAAALLAQRPALVLIEDLRRRVPAPDLAASVRQLLGLVGAA